MKTKTGLSVLTVFFACLFSMAFLSVSGAATPGKTDKGRTLESYGKLPLYFIENKGQVDPKVKFYVKTSGQTLYFTDEGIVFDLLRGKTEALKGAKRDGEEKKPIAKNQTERLVFSLAFDNAREGISIAGVEKQGAKVNYLLGGDKTRWKRDIPTYEGIVYKGVYEGIDFKIRGDGKAIKYDFIVNPGADPGDIWLSYNGIEGLSASEKGELIIRTAFGELKETKPYIYQEIEGKTVEVSGGFRVQKTATQATQGKSSYGFRVASYNSSYPLIIDPTLHYSTYLGGSGTDIGYGIAVDTSGNAYVTGRTRSSNFPTLNPYKGSYSGSDDAFIAKFSADGTSLTYSTYLGGDGQDYGYGIAVNTSGNAYVTGDTRSSDFPTQNPYQGSYSGSAISDAFITKLSADGTSLVYSTYLRGSGHDYGYGIAVDSSGNAYVTGATESDDFPTQDAYQSNLLGNQDAFITKLSYSAPTLSLTYSTYLGGDLWDVGYGIAIDSDNNAYVTGYTWSDDFPTKNPYQGSYGGSIDAFITKLSFSDDLTLSLTYSTYLGGDGNDEGKSITIDSSGNAYVTGYTKSDDFPTQNPYQETVGSAQDAFISKLDPTQTGQDSLTYSTYLGGTGTDEGKSIAVDSSGNAYVTGYTYSADFPTQNPYQESYGGSGDAFITKLDPTQIGQDSLTYSTYLGGTGDEEGHGIAIDSDNNAYVTGYTSSTDFPTQNPYQESYGGGTYDAFVLKYQGENLTTVTTTAPSAISSLSAASGGEVTADGGATVTARGVCWNTEEDPTTEDDKTSDGTGTGTFTSNITDLSPGTTYYVRAYATNSAGTSYGNNKSFSTLPAISPGTYYVDIQNGSDSNDGSSASPWKTLHHAFDQINGGSAGSAENGYVLHVLLGATYNTDNGEANRELAISQNYVTIIGESGSKPTISGPSSGNWENGIKVTSSHVTLRNLNVTGFTGSSRIGIEFVGSAEARTTNNTIEICRVYGNYDGISISNSNVFTIQDSEIDNNDFDGISINDCTTQTSNGLITRNTIHDNFEVDNSDGIIVQNCNPEISRNKIYDNRFNISIQAYDSEVTSPTIKNNLIYEDTADEVDYGILMGGNNTSTVSPKIYHNTIDKGTYEGILVEKYGTSTISPEIKYNIITNFEQYGIQNNSGNPTINYNDVWNNGNSAADNYKYCTAGANDISSDPKYGSYTLQSDSPCINAIDEDEAAEDPVTLDYPGFKRPRPGKTTKDMGAYEYVANMTDSYTLPGGTGVATDYRIFTVPLKLGTGADMLTAMEIVLGTYDPTHWRGFAFKSSGYIEFVDDPNTFPTLPIIPGMGFWIITTYTNQIPFEGEPAPDGVDYVMDLEPGWHLIGLPWVSENITLGSIQVTDGVNTYYITDPPNDLTQRLMWDYTGTGPFNGYEKRDLSTYVLQSGTGYFLKVLSSKNVTLIIPPRSDERSRREERGSTGDEEEPPPPPGGYPPGFPCPDISSGRLENVEFPSTGNCQYQFKGKLTLGNGVTIKEGANVTFKSE